MGKTTAVLEWMREAPADELRVMVCHSNQEAMRLLRENCYCDCIDTCPGESKCECWHHVDGLLETWQFVSHHELMNGGQALWSAVTHFREGQIVLAIDNLDLLFPSLFGRRVGMITLSAKQGQVRFMGD